MLKGLDLYLELKVEHISGSHDRVAGGLCQVWGEGLGPKRQICFIGTLSFIKGGAGHSWCSPFLEGCERILEDCRMMSFPESLPGAEYVCTIPSASRMSLSQHSSRGTIERKLRLRELSGLGA